MPDRKILLAEDDAKLRHEIGVFLRQHDFNVICVEDCYQATNFAIKEKPDLLLLDIHMPAGDGFGVHERVQKIPALALTPVIYMNRDPSTKLDALAECDHAKLLHKPFAMEKLLHAVTVALDPSSAEAA